MMAFFPLNRNYRFTGIFLLFFVFSCSKALAQEVLLQQSNDKSDLTPSFGPNDRHYVYGSMGAGIYLGSSGQSLKMNYLESNYFQLIIHYKFKLNSSFALGAESGVIFGRYRFEKNSSNVFVDTLFQGAGKTPHLHSGFSMQDIPIGAWLRWNLDPERGSTIGKYIDLGGQILLKAGDQYIVVDKLPNDVQQTTEFSGMPQVNFISEEVFVRLGISILSLSANYRLNPYFKSGSGFPDLPRFRVGVDLNFVR